MNHDKWCAHNKHTTWATHVRVIQWENATCEVWCSHHAGCSRLLSAVNDLTATNWKNQNSWKSTRLRLCEETAQRVSPSSVADFLVNCHELQQESFHCHQDVLCASLSIWMQTSSLRSMLVWDSRSMESFKKRSWIPSRLEPSTRKCDVWGVLFTHPVGCSRLLWAPNILTKTKKSCKVSLLSSLVKKPHNGSRRSMMPLLHELRGAWPLMNFMSSTRNRSTATMMRWMKKTTDAISDTARKESVQVALLQTHGEDGATLLMLRWSLIGVSSVHCVQMCWVVSKVLVLRHAIGEIFLRILVHLDAYFFSSINSELRVTKC